MRDEGSRYALFAASLAAALSGFELIRQLLGGGFVPKTSAIAASIVALLFCVALAGSAIGVAQSRRYGLAIGTLGTIAAIGYGIYVRAIGNLLGTAYVLAGGLMVFFLLKSVPYFREEAASV